MASTKRRKKDRTCECLFCQRIFADSWKLEEHIHTHTDERPYVCTKCDLFFRFKNNLWTHRRVVHQGIKWKCPYCEQEFNATSNLWSHKNRIHGHMSNKSSLNKTTVQAKKTTTNRKFSNAFGGKSKTIKKRVYVKKAKKKVLVAKNKRQPKTVKKKKAPKGVVKSEIKEEEEESFQDDAHAISDIKAQVVQNLEQNQNSHGGKKTRVWTCEICCKTFRCKKYNLDRHVRRFHSVDSQKQNQQQAPVSVGTKKKKQKTKTTISAPTKMTIASRVVPNKWLKVWTCGICSRKFGKKYHMERHMASLHSVKFQQSSISPPARRKKKKSTSSCPKVKKTASSVSVIIPKKSVKFWTCDLCGKTLYGGKKSNIERHKRNVHAGDSHQKKNQQQHISTPAVAATTGANDWDSATRTGRAKRFFKCEICLKVYHSVNRAILHRHQKSVHGIEPPAKVKCWKCDICGKEFRCKDRTNLNRHKRNVHLVDSRKQQQQQQHHDDEPSISATGKTIKTELKADVVVALSVTASGRVKKLFKCEICSKVYHSTDRTSLNRHKQSAHGIKRSIVIPKKVTKIWKCDICDKVFRCTDRHSLIRHKKRTHGLSSEHLSQQPVDLPIDLELESLLNPITTENSKESESGIPFPTSMEPPDDFYFHPPFKLYNFPAETPPRKILDSSFFLHMNRYKPDVECSTTIPSATTSQPVSAIDKIKTESIPIQDIKQQVEENCQFVPNSPAQVGTVKEEFILPDDLEQTTSPPQQQPEMDARAPRPCPKCGKVLTDKWKFQRHQKIVDCVTMKRLRDMPVSSIWYSCHFCKKEFGERRCHLLRHIVQLHPYQDPGEVDEDSSSLAQNSFEFSCGFCGLNFERRDNINRHILLSHHTMLGIPRESSQS